MKETQVVNKQTSASDLLAIIFPPNARHNGFVVVERKSGDAMRHVASFQTTNTSEAGKIKQYCDYDYYYGKAQMIHPGICSSDNVFAFNGIFIDIDSHEKQIDLDGLETTVIGMIEEDGTIACPNAIVRSGRGMHVIWLIDQHPACYAPAVRSITQYFAEVVSDLLTASGNPDFLNLIDARATNNIYGLTRLPGGTNSKNGSEVTYRILSDRPIDFDAAYDSAMARAVKTNRQHNVSSLAALGERRMRAIAEASKQNCGCENEEGYRDITLFHYCNASLLAGYNSNEALERCQLLNETFAKPLPRKKVESCLSTTLTGKYKISNKCIIEELDISAEIQKKYGLDGSLRKGSNYARNTRRAEKKNKRNAQIVELHRQGLTNAAIAKKIGCHHDTVRVALMSLIQKEQVAKKSNHISTTISPSTAIPTLSKAGNDRCQKWKRQIIGPMFHSSSEAGDATIDTFAKAGAAVGQGEYMVLNKRGTLAYVNASTGEMLKVEKKHAKVQANCHITVEKQNYSVPYGLAGKMVEVRIVGGKIDIFADGTIVATHTRLRGKSGQYSTNPNHMPTNPKVLDWNSDRFLRWARQIGTSTEGVVRSIFNRYLVEQQAYKSVKALLLLSKKYDQAQLEWACGQALSGLRYVTYPRICGLLEGEFGARR